MSQFFFFSQLRVLPLQKSLNLLEPYDYLQRKLIQLEFAQFLSHDPLKNIFH